MVLQLRELVSLGFATCAADVKERQKSTHKDT